ncbi:hypothetical protein [Kitasatospora atroaurantiaca]|uniref:Uncharacterized protein n=1 Tax=Kitasatospora atroaurantiaca TaxID=285545 RepID=A0A561EUI6_9ACTN|nr:hypothetical protein [Kitasatospora atroaurantiaca]TWE19282.1 hypothetical protein FB465_4398 [Kitasatospora atroaurantiaca]
MYDEVLLTIQGETATPVDRVSLPDLELQERAHLQEWLLANPEILGVGVEIITSEYDRWQTAAGDPVLDRLDLLAVAPDGHLIVAELKRGVAPHTIHMQAINYAAMVSRLTPQDIAELYAATLRRRGQEIDVESALTKLTTEFLLTSETIRRPRIALVASDFPPSVTASVVWLNEQQVDIWLIRFRPYQLAGGQLVVSFSRLFPVPDVEEFTIGRRAEVPLTAGDDPGAPWDEPSLRRLAEQGNPTTVALLDLCSADDPGGVGVKEIAAHAGVTLGAVRGQLAGLTMKLNNPNNGFAQNKWPARVEWLPGGVASYQMDPSLAAIWRVIRQRQPLPSDEDQD